ncbi:Pr6Pr family membrane protein [Cryobacterium tepidiphilum]|uniref:FAR-17a/AIG1-like protein n=1 Tax=Cryobacterium tepidiphilum TaxID=2486026 RepID=A0A3M8L0N0_9MICO|nr:Pr6Pr family membrane protein [Cryobacterium tepidiphilum]RNE59097.1 hypothetical protein EEJ31_11305 [Cryobacterium tepidiphilum]
MRKVFGVARILVALTGIVAMIGDFNYSIGTSPFATGNFFSYFTIQSMIVGVTVFVIGAVNALRQPEDPLWLDMVRLISTTYLIVSGIVFAFILIEGTLRGIPVWAPWSSQLMHFWISGFALLDWLIAPGRDAPWKTVPWVLVFPAVWLVYTMIRGTYVYWYPYFFLDPAIVEVPYEFSIYLLAIIAVFTGVTSLLLAISRVPRLEHVRERWGRNRPAPAARRRRDRRTVQG